MELSSTIFSDILSPLAIFTEDTDSDHDYDHQSQTVEDGSQQRPPAGLSPSTINGYHAPRTPAWRLDGVDIDGIRFFAVPTFAIGTPPLRIDVYIPPLEEHSPAVRQALSPAEAIYTTNMQHATDLPISRHLLQALEHWSSPLPDFENQYLSLPFGSQIVVTELHPDPITTASSIQLVPNYAVEQVMMSLDCLQQLWPSDLPWPEAIDTTDLHFRSQIHEAITLVTIPSSLCLNREYVFKSLLRDQKYLYNELKMLLSLPPHPNLVPRPLYVVTHRCRFGGKRGVAGFVLEYCPLGSMAGYLRTVSTLSSNASLLLSDRFRWARQITSVLIHVNNHCNGFYPDLKPDNIVLRHNPERGETDAVLLDLEQRGGWFSWSPPEVAYVEYIEILASRAPDARTREELTVLLRRYIPTWTPPVQDERYRNVAGGFSAPWLALAAERNATGCLETLLERAQTFMLGKLLWCIFEGRSVVRCGIDHELLRDPDPEFGGRDGAFPEFVETPMEVRELIVACTAGAPEWAGRRRGLVLREGRLVLAAWHGDGSCPSAGETREVARRWWKSEVHAANEFLAEMTEVKRGGALLPDGVLGNAMKRPLLQDVLTVLKRCERSSAPPS
ncbi:hypothetical protein GE09DRAFT_1279188 [Coniochaeta sp. 2T2.1]|nr:hypothetical protein GE09DRAFT_1279188 [Coniochaeta sp. 2T2.1]